MKKQFGIVCGLIAALGLSLAFIADVKATPAIEDKTPAAPAISKTEQAQSPKASALAAEFAAKHLKLGSPVFVRVYKQTSKMEIWVEKGSRYELFKTYGICRWAGGLGPKMYEGDRQSPEGLYHITSNDLIVNARWHRAMNINYPNRFDVMNGRGGSGILIHGKCGSVGCFAIQDTNVEEVYTIVRAALNNGQASIPVLALPFSFAKYAPAVEDTLKLNQFWVDLRRADLLFNRDRVPPVAWVCDGRYYFSDRRGDRTGHTVHLPGCKPLDKPISEQEAATLSERSQSVLVASNERNGWLISTMGIKRAVLNEDPKEAVEEAAKTCDPKQVQCRMLKEAVKSTDTICPTKYPRCRTAQATFTKSVECPLKYPRCRFFVGKEPAHLASSRSNKIKQR